MLSFKTLFSNTITAITLSQLVFVDAFRLQPNNAKRLNATDAVFGGAKATILQHPADWSRNIFPIPVHSHNDYWRDVPILDALANGVYSMESDVWLNPDDKELYVGHDPFALSKERTFESLTLKPLKKAIDQANAANHIHSNTQEAKFFANLQNQTFPQINSSSTSRVGFYSAGVGLSAPLQLLIDIKTDGNETFPYIVKCLQPLADQGYLTKYDAKTNKTIPGPITIIGTGNTPINQLINLPSPRFVYFDCPLGKLDSPFTVNGTSYKYDHTICGIASTNLGSITNYKGIDSATDVQRKNLTDAINQAHSYNIKTRVWDTREYFTDK
ncbi:hypothetical protein L7F22_068123 [Adiantum nelumboides]|nr:hypothetical protein [Adiantum nelumboides]